MKRQNDWYCGINYYDNYLEREIEVEAVTLEDPMKKGLREQVEMLFIRAGKAVIRVNGCDYAAEAGDFFCLYTHHFYEIHTILEKLEMVVVRFYIGLFMYMTWEKHPKNANAKLMYDTKPVVRLSLDQKKEIAFLFEGLLKEKKTGRFGSKNLVEYKTLELHMYFCRYAFEAIVKGTPEENKVWRIIKNIMLSSGEELLLTEEAERFGCSAKNLNRQIKNACGYTFFQLQQAGKMLYACGLLHFPDLEMNYISDLLGFSSVTVFYRIFQRYCKMTPREYQKSRIGNSDQVFLGTDIAMQFLQYMHLNFFKELTLETLSGAFYMKPYTAKKIFANVFGEGFKSVLNQIRVSYAVAFLKTQHYSAMEVSSLCGFDSYGTFKRVFKEIMNQAPREYMDLME
ncbi:MAG: AraC family transcriptional regulator [Eubacterium sp.]